MTDPLKNPHLLREWEQAWNHYRHLESTRSQYLGFFYTVQLALVGLAVGLVKGAEPAAETAVIFGLMMLAFVDFVVTIGLFTAVKKMGYILRRYETIMATVRKRSNVVSSSDLPFDLADVEGYPPQVLDSSLFSVQKSSERTVAGVSLVLMGLLVTLAAFLFVSSMPFSVWQQCVGVGIAASAIAYVFAVYIPLMRRNK